MVEESQLVKLVKLVKFLRNIFSELLAVNSVLVIKVTLSGIFFSPFFPFDFFRMFMCGMPSVSIF